MSNSALISFTKLSPNHSGKRTRAIDTISPHCMAGNLTVETCGHLFSQSSRQASSNYGIGSDGRIALYVDEDNRSWCTSNAANDQRAVTIEVANDGGAPDWSISDKAYAALVDLMVDICRRNNIKCLIWSTTKDDRINHRDGCNLTIHRDYAAKACPGDYIYKHMAQIANDVNNRLGVEEDKPTTPSPAPAKGIVKDSVVRVKQGAKTYDGGGLASFVYTRNHVVSEVSGDRCVITYSGVVVAAVRKSDLTLVSGGGSSSDKPTTPSPAPTQGIVKGSVVRVKSGAKDYNGGGLAGFVYTRDHVVSEVSGDRCVITYNGVVVAAVRKSDLTLVSGGGSSSDKPTTPAPVPTQKIVKGSVVRVKQGAKDYNGGGLVSFVYTRDHIVSEVSGDRCVITYSGVVVAAVHKSDLTLV